MCAKDWFGAKKSLNVDLKPVSLEAIFKNTFLDLGPLGYT